MTPSCIDLRPICLERRWRWQFEESFRAEGMRSTNPDAAWYVEIVCRNGTIYPFGADELLVCVEDHLKIAARLCRIVPDLRPHQGASVFRFPVELLEQVAAIMKPKRLPGRFATQEDVSRLAKTGFRGGNRAAYPPESRAGVPV